MFRDSGELNLGDVSGDTVGKEAAKNVRNDSTSPGEWILIVKWLATALETNRDVRTTIHICS